MKVSLIIPVYNEAASISAFMDGLDRLTGKPEIIFADGGSTDGTQEIIAAHVATAQRVSCRVLNCPKGRARQMNAAAEHASGDVLWFVHCDSALPEDACAQIAAAVADGAKFGCFHIGFDDGGLLMRCNAFMSNMRAKIGRIAFGDQGIFVRRELFFDVGGFPDMPIMEDYEFSRMMKRRQRRGFHGVPLMVLPGRIITSARRYRAGCALLVMLKMIWLRALYLAGTDIDEIARRYRDIR